MPFLVANIPPLPDFPGHVSQYHIMLNLGRSHYLQRYYDFKWIFTGNLGVDLLMKIVGPFLGAARGAWAITALTPALMVAGIFALSRAIHGQVQPCAFLALPFVYASAFLWGFLNYGLAVSLALLAFALWINWRERRWLRASAFAAIAVVLWICHAAGWGLLCLCIGGYEFEAALRNRGLRLAAIRQTIVAVWPLIPPALLSAIMIHQSHVPYPVEVTTSFGKAWLAYKVSIFATQLHDQFFPLDALSFLALGGLYAFSRSRGSLIIPALAVPAALVCLATIWLPPIVSGSALADYRLAPVSIILFFLSLRAGQAASGPLIAGLTLIVFGMRLAVTAFGWHQASTIYERHLSALNVVPMGARILVLVPSEGLDFVSYKARPLGHLADLAVVRRDALVNSLWLNTGALPLEIKANTDIVYFADPSQFIAPSKVSQILKSVRRDHFDYAWVLGNYPVDASTDNLRRVYADEETELFRVAR